MQMFMNARLFGLKKLGAEWGSYEYIGNVTDLSYEKDSKANFFTSISNELTLVGKLGICDNYKLTNNSMMIFMNFADIIQAFEKIRTEGKLKHDLSALTLNQLIQEIEINPY
jgi:hypothetical protein